MRRTGGSLCTILVLVLAGCSGDADAPGKDIPDAEDVFAALSNGPSAASTGSRWASTPCLGSATFSITADGSGRQQRGPDGGPLSGIAAMTWTRQGDRAVLFAPEALDGDAPACETAGAKCLGSIAGIVMDPDGPGFAGQVAFTDGQQASCRFVRIGGTWPECGECSGASDRCVAGVCRCGDRTPCMGGVACTDAWCGCKAACTTGCCAGSQCLAGTEDTACGKDADVCQDCTAAGQVCKSITYCRDACPRGTPTGGECRTPCNANTCPDGCCTDEYTCVTVPTVSQCGLGGIHCVDCVFKAYPTDQDTADRCDDNGTCVCGNEGRRCGGSGWQEVCIAGKCG